MNTKLNKPTVVHACSNANRASCRVSVVNCPACDQTMSRRLNERHYECGCGSLFIPPQRGGDGFRRILNGFFKSHRQAFNGSNAAGRGITVAKSLKAVGDAVQAVRTPFKGSGDLDQRVGFGGHDANQTGNSNNSSL